MINNANLQNDTLYIDLWSDVFVCKQVSHLLCSLKHGNHGTIIMGFMHGL